MLIKNISYFVKKYKKGNVSVCGMTGTGKDMLTANVVVRRKLPYVSNMDYGGQYMPLKLELLDCGQNSYKDFIAGSLKRYEYPYCDKTDVYISDAGVYFPCQYDEQITKEYPQLATLFALCRHIGEFNIHTNSQALCRVYSKIREQSDQYISCKFCKVFFKKFVVQYVIEYDKYQSAIDNIKPFKMKNPYPFFSKKYKEFESMIQIKKLEYYNSHGTIKPILMFYINKSKYDTRRFKTMLREGRIIEEQKNNQPKQSFKKIS